MENAEEVMQLLEQFSKIKPKDIPRELDDYLGYVAKTGDPVYQWSLIKNLFREKLINVITDFFESTLTVELPPCPNVEPFNYERMKTSLLERFDTFASAPFTVQRICELLTNPRKEYNRADKYMRAIEKNILVVSTREPGMGKRSLECDNQSETVLNGITDVRLNESDGNLLHVPTDLPYLGAPPASNDITVETSETNITVTDRLGLDTERASKMFKPDIEKPWTAEEPVSTALQEQSNSETGNKSEVSVSIGEKCPEEKDCDLTSGPSTLTNDNNSTSDRVTTYTSTEQGDCDSDNFIHNSELILPDSIDSSQEDTEIQSTLRQDNDDIENSDENEVSSTPEEPCTEVPLVQQIVPTDSEAEATYTSIDQDNESEINSLNDNEINSSDRVIQMEESKLITISEVSATKSDELDIECNEITGTVVSPISPGCSSNLQTDEVEQHIIINVLDESEQSDSHPDSSDDLCIETKDHKLKELLSPEVSSEADSLSETNEEGICESGRKNSFSEDIPDQTNNKISDNNIVHVSSPGSSKLNEDESVDKVQENSMLLSDSQEEMVSGGQCLDDNSAKDSDLQSPSDDTSKLYTDRREESVIHSVSNITPDSQQQTTTIEEINVDPVCEAEEEAMDVDDTSNQMMIIEGENEGEPMDQSDQLQS